MTNELRVYFSFRSPYSRLGLHKIRLGGFEKKVPVKIIPFVSMAEGVPFFDPMSSPPKMAYYMEDAPRMTQRLGLPMRAPTPFEVSLTRANKAFIAADNLAKGLEYAIAVSDARWGKGQNISDMSVLAVCAEEVGLPADMPKQAKADAAIASALEKCAEKSAADQVFGVPFAVLEADGSTQKFWGQDRFDLLPEIIST
ncbi:MAG: DsbA family protein [Aquisalinus sp.]|nr:DsbA family protein [Aquisalinus sp.]